MIKVLNISCLIFLISTMIIIPSFAANPPPVKKPKLVLMPLILNDGNSKLQGAMETAVAEGLQDRYTVFSGDSVKKKVKESFTNESKTSKHECDETKCMANVAVAFDSALLAVVSVTKVDSGYFLALKIEDIYDNKTIYSKSLPYKNSDDFEIIEKLKELAGGKTATSGEYDFLSSSIIEEKSIKTNIPDAETSLWNEVQRNNTEDDYIVYLDIYKNGKYAPLAKAHIKKIKDTAREQAKEQEQRAWDTTQQYNSESSYASYLESYPNGTFAGLAKVRQNKLKTERITSAEQAIKQRETSTYETQNTTGDSRRGRDLSAKCAACHGAAFEKVALGRSNIVKIQSAYSIEASLKAYKAGAQNKAGMGALMKAQVAAFSDNDIKDIAAYITTIR